MGCCDSASRCNCFAPARLAPPLWQKIERARQRSPRFAYALARVAHEVARHTKNSTLRARAELALIQTLNTLGEFPDALAGCEKTAARFTKNGDAAHCARVWLKAARAETERGNLDAARAYVERAIVASLWNVDNSSTAQLMKLFYRNLEREKSIAEALHRAQLALYRQGLSAYHWAAFVAMGEV